MQNECLGILMCPTFVFSRQTHFMCQSSQTYKYDSFIYMFVSGLNETMGNTQ